MDDPDDWEDKLYKTVKNDTLNRQASEESSRMDEDTEDVEEVIQCQS